MHPSEIIIYRYQLYKEKRFQEIYKLYNDNSLVKKIHPYLDDYISFMLEFSKSIKIEKIEILNENIKKNLSQVTFIEYININQNQIIQHCTSYMKNINGTWKIIKEKRKQLAL